ncbi:MAG: hypothetical protein Q4D27_04585 [Coriobacteriia bacterium]|nr:hypothetical protein [Coriobacteriia bacterium]
MGIFRASYESPRNANPQSGQFTFESKHPLNSKANEQDARYRMLDLFGNEAVAWSVTHIERAKAAEADAPVQLGLDFREPKKTRKRRTVERGKL